MAKKPKHKGQKQYWNKSSKDFLNGPYKKILNKTASQAVQGKGVWSPLAPLLGTFSWSGEASWPVSAVLSLKGMESRVEQRNKWSLYWLYWVLSAETRDGTRRMSLRRWLLWPILQLHLINKGSFKDFSPPYDLGKAKWENLLIEGGKLDWMCPLVYDFS